MKRILLFLSTLAVAVGLLNAQTTPHNTVAFTTPPPASVSQLGATILGNSGPRSYTYFVIATYPIGNVVSTPLLVVGAANTLDSSHYIQLSWNAPGSGVLTYDVVRYDGQVTSPSNCSNCLVVGATTSLTVNDQTATLSGSYTFTNLVGPANGSITLNNKDYAIPTLLVTPPIPLQNTLEATNYGSAKNDVTLQAAINAAITSHLRLHIPAGNWALSAPLVINAANNVQIYGDGANNTLLIVNGNFDAIQITGVSTNIIIRDLWIGSFVSRASGYGIYMLGAAGGNVIAYVTVDNVRIQNIANPLYMRYVQQSQFRNIYIPQTISGATKGDAIYVEDSVSIRFNNVRITSTAGVTPAHLLDLDSNDDTIDVQQSEFLQGSLSNVYTQNSLGGSNTGPRLVRFTDVYSESGSAAGFEITAARDVRLEGCHAAVNGAQGYLISGGQAITIINSLAFTNATYGFQVTGGTGVVLVGNTASNNSSSITNTYAGIDVSGATGVQLANNRSEDFILSQPNSQKYGILVEGGADFTYITNNKLTANVTAPLSITSGTHNYIQQPESPQTPQWLRFLGDGSEGALTCTDANISSGEHWYSSFTVNAGHTCNYSSSSRIGTIIRATGACTIAGTMTASTLSSFQGDSGGSGGGGGGGTAAGVAGKEVAPNSYFGSFFAAGGTAGASSGGPGGNGAMPIAVFQQEATSLGLLQRGGSPGGAGGTSGPAGANGATSLVLDCGSINFTGTIQANGLNGAPSTANNMGASGGGGAAAILFATPFYTANTGQVDIQGGQGGQCANPAVLLSGPADGSIVGATSGTGALAHISAYSGGNPSGITVDNVGSGYNFTPTCTIVGTGGGANTGSGATCTVTMVGVAPSMTVASIAVLGGNAGYGTGTTFTGCGLGGYGGNGWFRALTTY